MSISLGTRTLLVFLLTASSILGGVAVGQGREDIGTMDSAPYTEVYYGANPVIIDGTINDEEWNDSTVSMTDPPRILRMYSKEDASHLLLAVDCPDPSIVEIGFDVNDSGGRAPQSGDFKIHLGYETAEYEGDGSGWTQ